MSAGKFQLVKYKSSPEFGSRIHSIKCQPETYETLEIDNVVNGQPTGAYTEGAPRVRVSGSKRAYGIKARTVTLRWTSGAPAGYDPNSLIRVPVLEPTHFSTYVNPIGKTGFYLDEEVQVVGFSFEGGRG